MCKTGDMWFNVFILPDIKQKWDGEVDWIDLAQESYRWASLVKSVMTIRVTQNAGNSRLDDEYYLICSVNCNWV